MFNIFKKTKKQENETKELIVQEEKKELLEIVGVLGASFVAFSHKNSIKEITLDSDYEHYLKMAQKVIDSELELVQEEFNVTLLYNSNEFLVKQAKIDENENEYEFFAQKHLDNFGKFELKKIAQNSYLIAKDEFLKDLLLLFKNYTVNTVYDCSLLFGTSLVKSPSEIYID